MLKLTPEGTIQMLVSEGVYAIKGNNKIMLDGDGCLYTNSYCFHGHYVFKYNTDIHLGNFYYAPQNNASDGNFVISLPSGVITTSNLIGAYSLTPWFADLAFMLSKRNFSAKFSVCKGSTVNNSSGTEQSAFLTSGGFTATEYSSARPAPSLLGNKVTSVSGATIRSDNSKITITNTTRVYNNLYYSIYVSLS